MSRRNRKKTVAEAPVIPFDDTPDEGVNPDLEEAMAEVDQILEIANAPALETDNAVIDQVDEIAAEEEETVIPRYAVRRIKIDSKTTKKMTIEVDEATSEVCGYNVFIVNGDKLPFKSLEAADPIQAELVKTILAKHMDLHSPHDLAVARVRSDEIARKKKPWLFNEGE
jgi:hypothetical protein